MSSWGRVAAEYLRRNVLGLVAIFIALSGTAYANLSVGAGDIERNAVRAKHLATKQVRAKHLARNSVRPKHLMKRAVKARHVTPQSIKGWALADGAITADKLAPELASMRGLEGPQGPAGPPGDPASVDGRQMGGDLAGTFPNPEIASGAVTMGKIAAGAVGTAQLGSSAVTSGKIGPQAVGTGAITNSAITPVKLQDGAVRTAKIEDDAVTTAKLGPKSLRGRHFFNSGTFQLTPGMIPPGTCSGMTITSSPPGPGVAVASLAPGASAGLVATTGYLNNQAQLGVRVCNLTETSLPVPAYVNYLFIEL